jgi:hypothetical protein
MRISLMQNIVRFSSDIGAISSKNNFQSNGFDARGSAYKNNKEQAPHSVISQKTVI